MNLIYINRNGFQRPPYLLQKKMCGFLKKIMFVELWLCKVSSQAIREKISSHVTADSALMYNINCQCNINHMVMIAHAIMECERCDSIYSAFEVYAQLEYRTLVLQVASSIFCSDADF